MSLVDANVVLRYLLDDHEELSPKAADILERHAVTLPMEVGCEVVYVLQKVYAVERKEIQQQLGDLLNEGLVSMDKPVVANPPFSYRWEPSEAPGEDMRFKNYGLAPKSAADFFDELAEGKTPTSECR